MGGRSSSSNILAFEKRVDNLTAPTKATMFEDSRISPLAYDKSQLHEVAFGDWQSDDNYIGTRDVSVSDIVTVQPYVQANKLKAFKGPIDTSNIAVLQMGDKYYVGDGNHRIVTSMLRGRQTVRVRVYRKAN